MGTSDRRELSGFVNVDGKTVDVNVFVSYSIIIFEFTHENLADARCLTKHQHSTEEQQPIFRSCLPTQRCCFYWSLECGLG